MEGSSEDEPAPSMVLTSALLLWLDPRALAVFLRGDVCVEEGGEYV